MLDWTDPVKTLTALFDGSLTTEEMWLAAVNLILGIVVLFFVVMLAAAVVKEVFARRRERSLARQAASYQAVDGELGLVMADGGEPVEKDKE